LLPLLAMRCYAPSVRIQAWLTSALLVMASLGVTSVSSAQIPRSSDAPEASADRSVDGTAGDARSPDQEQQVSDLLDEEARTRFQLGSTLYRQGRFDDAAREFRGAYDVSHRPELLYNLYLVERDAGHTQEAADALRTYLSDASQIPDRGLMEGRLAALDEQLERARAAQDATHGDTSDDGAEVGAAIDAPPPVEPPSRVLPIALMAAGGAVLLVGGGFAFAAKSKHDDLDAVCVAGRCPNSSQSDIDALHRDTLIADLSFAIGGVSVATGLLLLLLRHGSNENEPSVSAGCGPEGCGLSLQGRF